MTASTRARSTLIVDRDDDIRRLEHALHAARDGHGGMLLVRGVLGIGKSALLQATGQLGGEQGMTVLRAQATELERSLPFGIALQLLERYLNGLDPADRDAVMSGAARPAAILFDKMPAAASPNGELPLLHGLYWLLANVSDRVPLVVLIDDAHWADRSSLAWLEYLAPRLDEHRVVVVVAFRPNEPDAEGDHLDRLVALETTELVRPQLLTEAGGVRVVRDVFPSSDEAFCLACVETAGGWPLMLREILAGVAEHELEPTADSAGLVRGLEPRSIRHATQQRLARLGDEATALARALAVLGRDAQMRHAAELAGLSPSRASAVADTLAAAYVLDAEELAFSHAVVGPIVYDDVPAHARAEMHQRSAELLAHDGAPADRVAAHLLRATPDGAAWAVEALRNAGRRAARDGDPAVAAQLLRRALDEPPAPWLRADVTAELAHAQAAAGDVEAASTFDAAMDLAGDPVSRAVLANEYARFLGATGRPKDAGAVLDGAVDGLGPDEDDLRAELQATWVSISRTDTDMRREAAARIASVLGTSAGPPSLAQRKVLAHVAREKVFAGEPRDDAVRLARLAYAEGQLLADETSDGVTWVAALSALGWADHLDEFDQGFQEGLADARRRGSVMAFATCSHALMFSHYYTGRIADTIADAEQALPAEQHGWREYSPAARSQLAWALLERGDLAAAEQAIAPLLADESWRSFPGWGMVIDARGRIALARHHAESALADFLTAGELMDLAQLPNPAILPWASNAAIAAARLGDLDQARALVDRELAAATAFGAPRVTGITLRAAGVIESGDRSIDLLRESVAVLEESPATLERIRSLTDLGGALRRAGHPRDARDPLRQALHEAHMTGAVALEQRAREEIIVAGGRPRTPAMTGAQALTPSERRVAQMAATGLTNRQIAEDLFVTVKAVQWHLHNAYRKLDVHSRHQLIAALEETPREP
jgi:DNA-binding CsgD family transcriptional regulator/Tfp pilus assembly protein PilF